MRYVIDFSDGRDNNINLLRFLAAGAVLVSHAWPISSGPDATQPLQQSIGLTLGTVAVLFFFALSGFLIARSYDRGSSVARWTAARVLRLFPGLLVVLAITALVLGPLTTQLPVGEYLSDRRTLTYLPRNMSLWALQYDLPGVFVANPYGTAINGSLWTLVYEALCWIGVLVLGFTGLLRKGRLTAVAMVSIGVALVVIDQTNVLGLGVERLLRLGLLAQPFMIGVAIYIWRDRIPMTWGLAVGLAAAAALARDTVVFNYVFVVALSYWGFALAYLPTGAIRKFNLLGDYSYGIYIYAFPAQQLVVHFFGDQTPARNIALAAPLTLFFAVLSWHLVERRSLEARHRFGRTPSVAHAAGS